MVKRGLLIRLSGLINGEGEREWRRQPQSVKITPLFSGVVTLWIKEGVRDGGKRIRRDREGFCEEYNLK